MRTYGKIKWAQANELWMMEALPPHVAIRLKHLFPRIRKDCTGPFVFPDDDIHAADLSWFMVRYPLEISDADRAHLERRRAMFETMQAELERILLPEYRPSALIGLNPGQQIRPYQSQAIDVAHARRGLLLGDDLGLGKTYTALGFCLKPGTLPAAVVMQTHLQNQWAEKAAEFTTLRVHKIKGTRPYDLPDADIYLFKYSQILGWIDILEKAIFKTVVFDEVQELRTGSASGKGVAAYMLADKAQFRMGLSATPIYNYGEEIWSIMRAIDRNALGDIHDFRREWTGGTGKVGDPDALGTYLREQHLFIRRTKRDVGQQVPPVNRIIEIVGSDSSELDRVEDLARKLAIRVTSGAFTDRGQAARELDLLVRKATGVGKAKNVAAYVRILLENGIPLILVGWHRDVYDIWLRELVDFKPVMYTGTESPAQKDEAKRRFVSGETNLFIMSLRSGAGLDGLQYRCSTVVAGELDWSPKVHEQIIGRVDREGQTEQVTAIYLNSEDGSDPPMVELLGIKNAQATGIVDPGKPFEAVHSDDSRIKTLAARYLKNVKLPPRSIEQTPTQQSLRDAEPESTLAEPHSAV